MSNKLSSFFGRGKKKEDEERQQRENNRKAKEALEKRTEITQKVLDDIWGALKNGDNAPKMFVCDADLRRIWDYSRVIMPLAEHLDWCDQASMSQAKENFVRVMSILVWIKWDRWDQFGSLFLHHKNHRNIRDRTDKDLPFSDTSYLQTAPLRIPFQNEQFIFNPMVIIEDDPEVESEYKKYSDKDRLPFTYTKSIGRGGSGFVTKEEIPPLYFEWKNGSRNNDRPICIARKCFPSIGLFNPGFEAEQKNLKAFKKCLTQNGNIMQSYAAFLHGSQFNIISPLADLDLHTYFEGSYSDFHYRSTLFSPAYLLYGAACLAGALRFLHEGLQPEGIAEKIYCAHLDLKPENILVIWPRGANPPVGRWLLHDFGTSKIKKSRNMQSSKTLVAPGDFIRQFSLTQASRVPGPFQAPEVQNSTERVVGTESDIWSLGCILAQVLTFALGGPSFVSLLAQSMSEGFDDDYFYNVADFNFALKTPVVQYLNSLMSSCQDNIWISETLKLIYKMLVKDPGLRPSAKEVQDTLERVYRRLDPTLLAPCSWAKKDDPLPSPISASQEGHPQQFHPQNLYQQNISQQHHPQQYLPQPQSPQQFPQQSPRQFPQQFPQQPFSQQQPQIQRPLISNPGTYRPVPDHLPPKRSQASLPHVIIRPPTTINGSEEDQPGLEVAPSISSPKTDSLSHFELDSIHDMQKHRYNLSRSSSTSTRPVSLTEDVTFVRLYVQRSVFKSIICPSSCHVAFISKKKTSIMRIIDNDWTANQNPPIISAGYLQACTKDHPDSFEWVDGSMSGPYLVLKAKRINGRDCKIYRYKCDESGHTWNEEPVADTQSLATIALETTVSVWGDMVFICDDQLWYYSSKHGFLPLDTAGRHRIGSARFSPDGTWVFGWSHEGGINHFYKWVTTYHQRRSQTDDSATLGRIWHIKEQLRLPDRAGFGTPAIFPFLNYFVAFDRPDRVLTVGKHDSNPVVTQVQRDVRDIIGGISVQGTLLQKRVESLVLLQNNSGSLMTFPMTHQGAGNPSEGVKLKLKFNGDADALAVFETDSNFYIVVSHCDGRLERRRASST